MNGWIKALLVVAVLVVGAVLTLRPSDLRCDGNVPAWAADDFKGGCGYPPHLYEYVLPWHWGAPSVCIGLCTELAPGRSPT